MAGGAKSVADRRAWPLLGGIDSRRAATAAPRGAKGSTAMARDSATCSSPVSVVLGVGPGWSRGWTRGRRPRPRRARLRRRNRSRREAPSRRARCAGASPASRSACGRAPRSPRRQPRRSRRGSAAGPAAASRYRSCLPGTGTGGRIRRCPGRRAGGRREPVKETETNPRCLRVKCLTRRLAAEAGTGRSTRGSSRASESAWHTRARYAAVGGDGAGAGARCGCSVRVRARTLEARREGYFRRIRVRPSSREKPR